MKIWFSFASNHSSDYVVLGKFKSVSKAEEAAKVIRGKIKAMRDEEERFSEERGGTGYRDREFIYKKHGIDGGDWEDTPKVFTQKDVVKISIHTAGYGLDDLVRLLKEQGAIRAKRVELSAEEVGF